MTITNLFSKSGNRRVSQRFRMQKINPRTLENIKDFAEGLVLPEPEHRIYIELRDFVRAAGRERAPYCLLLLADREDISYVNVGYVAGQISVYLHFQGCCACILRDVPAIYQMVGDRVCVGIIAFGKAEQAGTRRQEGNGQTEAVCICRDLQGHWTEEVLALARKRFPIAANNVRIIRENNRVYFSPKFQNGKKKSISEFETGIAIAYALAAAEELWVDLVLAKSDSACHTICLMTARG